MRRLVSLANAFCSIFQRQVKGHGRNPLEPPAKPWMKLILENRLDASVLDRRDLWPLQDNTALRFFSLCAERRIEKVAPSVVNVSVTEEVHGKSVTNNNGSGVIVKSDGTILTAFDLVANQPRWFRRQWTPKGQIFVGLHDGRTLDANLAAADENLGIAVLKITSNSPLKPAATGDSYNIYEYGELINVEWPPTELNSVIGTIRAADRDIIHLHHLGFTNMYPAYPTNQVSFGGPILNWRGHVVGISQKKSPEDEFTIYGTPIEIAMKMVEELKVT